MCGRFEIHSTLEIIARIFQIDSVSFDVKPNYNVAPSQDVAVVINDGKNRLVPCRWGFAPSWAKELKTRYPMINARAETVATNASFRQAFERRRCLVIADGFYEWKKEGAIKKPYYIHLRSGKPFGFAGVYNARPSAEGGELRTCAIITTTANETVSQLHDRMPVIARPEFHRQWLDPRITGREELLDLLQSVSAEELEAYPVSAKVNSYKHNEPENIRRI